MGSMMYWVDQAQDRDMWQSSCECGNESLGFIKMRGIFSLSEKWFVSEERFCSMELVITIT